MTNGNAALGDVARKSAGMVTVMGFAVLAIASAARAMGRQAAWLEG